MPPFLTDGKREFFSIRLARPTAFETPFSESYPCLLWDHSGEWSVAERSTLIASLLRTDCRYAVCGGISCEKWHDEIDLAFITTIPEAEQDARFMMTSWHTDKPPLEVAWFFAWNTDFDEHEFQRFLVIELGVDVTNTSLESIVSRAVTDSEAAVDELDERAG